MNLIKKITIKHKLNGLYNDLQEECFKTSHDWRNHKISDMSAMYSYKGIARYATVRYRHICETYGIKDTDIKNDNRFGEMIYDIENTVDNLRESLKVKEA